VEASDWEAIETESQWSQTQQRPGVITRQAAGTATVLPCTGVITRLTAELCKCEVCCGAQQGFAQGADSISLEGRAQASDAQGRPRTVLSTDDLAWWDIRLCY